MSRYLKKKCSITYYDVEHIFLSVDCYCNVYSISMTWNWLNYIYDISNNMISKLNSSKGRKL